MHTWHTLIFKLFVQCIHCILWSSNYLFSVYLAYFNIQVICSVHTWHTLIFKLFVRCKLCTLRRAHCAIQLALHFVWLISCHKGQLQCRFFKTCVTLPLGGWVLQRQCALWIGELYFCTWWAVALRAFQTTNAKPPKRCHCASSLLGFLATNCWWRSYDVLLHCPLLTNNGKALMDTHKIVL